MKKIIASAAILIGLTAAASAGEKSDLGFFVGPQLSTLGAGIEGGWRFHESFGARANFNYLNLSETVEIDGNDFKGKIGLKSFGANLDYFPFDASGWHVSGGFRWNGNNAKISVTPNANETIEIGGNSYNLSQVGRLDGKVDFDNFAPYLGLGWMGSVFHPNVFLAADAGVMIHGSPKVTLACSGPACATIQDDIDREVRDIKKEVEDYKVYPVLSLTVGYKF